MAPNQRCLANLDCEIGRIFLPATPCDPLKKTGIHNVGCFPGQKGKKASIFSIFSPIGVTAQMLLSPLKETNCCCPMSRAATCIDAPVEDDWIPQCKTCKTQTHQIFGGIEENVKSPNWRSQCVIIAGANFFASQSVMWAMLRSNPGGEAGVQHPSYPKKILHWLCGTACLVKLVECLLLDLHVIIRYLN